MAGSTKLVVWNKYTLIITEHSHIIKLIWGLLSYKVTDSNFTYSGNTVESFLTKKNAFLTGFLPVLLKHFESITYEDWELVDRRLNSFEFNLDFNYKELPIGSLRENQADAVEAIIYQRFPIVWNRALIDAATNYGKNWLITMLVLLCSKTKVLVLVHRKELFTQLFEMFRQNGIKVSLYGELNKKSYKDLDHDTQVLLALNTTLSLATTEAKVKVFLSSVGMCIVDECHRATSMTYQNIYKEMDCFGWVYLSGTPFTGDPKHDLQVIGDSSKVTYQITSAELIDGGISQKPIITIYELSGFSYAIGYVEEKKEIIYDPQRLYVIRQEIIDNIDDIILISVAVKEHGEYLHSQLMSLPTVVEFIHSSDPLRQEKLLAFQEGRIKVLICTEVMKEGINAPLCRTLINAAWGKSIVWVKQFAGRLLRHDGIHNTCKIVDFIDRGFNTRKHSLDRCEIYSKEGYEIIHKKIT